MYSIRKDKCNNRDKYDEVTFILIHIRILMLDEISFLILTLHSVDNTDDFDVMAPYQVY